MAISGGDGSIILTTKVDETGLKKGFVSLKKLGETAGKAFLAIGAAATTATVAITKMAVSAYAEFEQLAGGVEKIFDQANIAQIMEDANNAFMELNMSANDYLRTMNDIGATFSATMGDQKGYDTARQGLLAISDYASGTGKNIDLLSEKFTMITRSASSYQSIADQFSGILPATSADFLAQAKAAGFLSNQYTKLTEVPIAEYQQAVTQMLSKGVDELGLTGNTAREAATTISGSLAMTKASWQNLLTAMAGGGDLDRAINNFVYSLEKFTANIVPVIERTLLGLGQAIQRTLPQLIQVIVSALIQSIPMIAVAVYNMIMGLFKGIIAGIKALFTGGTAKATEGIRENVSGISSGASSAADNMNDVADATKKAGKEAKKSLAAFDELNILSSGASGGANETPETSTPTISAGGGGGSLIQDFSQQIDAELAKIMAIAGASLLAIGLLLMFLGHPFWGISFIIAGAVTMVQAMQSGKKLNLDEITNGLSTIMGIAGGALLALGIILLWIGGVVGKGVAIGMIIAGGALIVSAVVAKAAFSPNDIKGWLSTILGIAAGALLALGIILCMVGSTPLGVGMIIAGSVSLVSAVALNFNEVTDKITGWVAVIMGIAGAALLILGIVLTASGANLVLGISLIAVGAVALVTPIALNWDEIKNKVTNFLKENSGLIVGISLALLVLGIILCCVGFINPLSIGLIVAGAVGLATEIAINWGNVKKNIIDFLKENSGLIVGISIALLVLGIILCCVGIINPLSIGLIAAGAVGLATEIALNWDNIKNSITNFIKENSGLIVGVSLALVVIGIVLLFTGVGIPLAIGLIVAGGGALAATVALNWNFIVDKVKEVWGKVRQFWNENIAPVFTAQWWADLGKNAMNGLIGAIENGLNYIIRKINTLSWNVPDWVPGIGGKKWGFNFKEIKIPRLAQGAVIPPNREFLAVLGDQKQGVNIEAPLQTIVDAFNIALQGNANYGDGNTEVVLEIDGREFGRAVVEQGNRENRRIGTRLVIA